MHVDDIYVFRSIRYMRRARLTYMHIQKLCMCCALVPYVYRINVQLGKGTLQSYRTIETAELFIEMGADVNAQGGKHGNALHAAYLESNVHLSVASHRVYSSVA